MQPLGSGSFGVVREVKCKRTKHRYAAKTVTGNGDADEEWVKLQGKHQFLKPGIDECPRVDQN